MEEAAAPCTGQSLLNPLLSEASSLLSLCPQLAARLGRRPAPGNLCTSTFTDLAPDWHHVCPRMWALGRCNDGGGDGGVLHEKKDRSRSWNRRAEGAFRLSCVTWKSWEWTPQNLQKQLTSTQTLDLRLCLSYLSSLHRGSSEWL